MWPVSKQPSQTVEKVDFTLNLQYIKAWICVNMETAFLAFERKYNTYIKKYLHRL